MLKAVQECLFSMFLHTRRLLGVYLAFYILPCSSIFWKELFTTFISIFYPQSPSPSIVFMPVLDIRHCIYPDMWQAHESTGILLPSKKGGALSQTSCVGSLQLLKSGFFEPTQQCMCVCKSFNIFFKYFIQMYSKEPTASITLRHSWIFPPVPALKCVTFSYISSSTSQTPDAIELFCFSVKGLLEQQTTNSSLKMCQCDSTAKSAADNVVKQGKALQLQLKSAKGPFLYLCYMFPFKIKALRFLGTCKNNSFLH